MSAIIKEVDYRKKPHFGHQFIINDKLEGKMRCSICGREFTWRGKTVNDDEPRFCFDRRVISRIGTSACKDYYERWIKHKATTANHKSGLNMSEEQLKQECDRMFKALLSKGLVC